MKAIDGGSMVFVPVKPRLVVIKSGADASFGLNYGDAENQEDPNGPAGTVQNVYVTLVVRRPVPSELRDDRELQLLLHQLRGVRNVNSSRTSPNGMLGPLRADAKILDSGTDPLAARARWLICCVGSAAPDGLHNQETRTALTTVTKRDGAISVLSARKFLILPIGESGRSEDPSQ
jgi:hypothetical protein